MTKGRTFGLVPGRGRGNGNWRGRGGRRVAGGSNFKGSKLPVLPNLDADGKEIQAGDLEARFEEIKKRDEIDEQLGFSRYQEGPTKIGWMVNMHPTLVRDDDWPSGRSACDYYFIEEDGSTFKCTFVYEPYFYIICKKNTEREVEEYLRRQFDKSIEKIVKLEMDDLDLPNHLLGNKRTLLKLVFRNVADLLAVRKVVLPAVQKNRQKNEAMEVYADTVMQSMQLEGTGKKSASRQIIDAIDNIVDIREYDVPYYLRAAIDNDLRVGLWYSIKAESGKITIEKKTDKLLPADPVVLAFDIETTKLPLKFPDAAIDSIMMISYMIDGQGFLITNREIVSEDIEDFEYTPKPDFEGPFIIFNEADEEALLRRFFEHIQEVKPQVFVTYNGDFFDWPFVEARAKVYNMDMHKEIGFYKDAAEEYKCFNAAHIDCLRWVKRDSYLPAGSHGLKAVTTSKLGYNPMELDPEDMTRFAAEQPQTLAQYSVSDAVATYYLYMKYVHPFIFSLCNIIPLNPDEVLRKGSGTLCETLLMVQAYKASVIMPNKHVEQIGKHFEGHLLESETYVGGHVEALEAGVFRSDVPTKFKITPAAVQKLIDDVDNALRFTLETEGKQSLDNIVNYEEVRDKIVSELEEIRDIPNRLECPLIYHLDVAAMYPNIILTNRLQPDAMITEEDCAACDFNKPNADCKRSMKWLWRGEFAPASRSEFNMIKNQLESERFPGRFETDAPRAFHELSASEQAGLIQKRLADYCRKVYRKVRDHKVIEKTSIVCQRENPFYINTVRSFRDRRYEYKGLLKVWKKKQDEATSEGDATKLYEAKKMVVVMDSLQLAHKCILNSFYGYVMRKGSRWYSMEMGGIVCHTGAKIIQMARELVEQVGRPLELDTDGIWCILPGSFPENFAFKLKNGKSFPISYPCVMLNHLVHDKFTNHQYQELVDAEKHLYKKISENSIFFEVDGPYRAMILPASTEEDKLLKKRYAVFNEDGSLAELKGFEVKRRGELKLIKIFQSQIFKVFLEGTTLEECYASVAKVANDWLDVLYSKGSNMEDDELLELISENRSMSKSLQEYGTQKSTSISTAKRLAEFLGDQMVKDKGLACKFIISEKPIGAPVAERAVPVAILQSEPAVKKHFLRKWLKDSSLTDFDIRTILDWNYYLERFGSVIQKLITIPAAMQNVRNPVPRVKHPDWLRKRVANLDDKFQQKRMTDFFGGRSKGDINPALEAENMDGDDDEDSGVDENIDTSNIGDLEDIGVLKSKIMNVKKRVAIVSKRARQREEVEDPEEQLKSLNEEQCPSMTDDYHGYLEFQKRKWKIQRLVKQKRRELFGELRSSRNNSSNVSNYFQRQAESLAFKTWQIVQIVETEVPGECRLWVLIDSSLHAIKLQIPRIFYVNTQEDSPTKFSSQVKLERVSKHLPHSHPVFNLYQVTTSESYYRANIEQITKSCNNPHVEGAYETRVPLLFRALLNLGCLCSIDRSKPQALRKGLEEGFELSDLKHETVGKSPYLPQLTDGLAPLHYLFLYHSQNEIRHVYALFSTVTRKATVVVVDPGNNLALPNLRNQYEERYQVRLSKEDLVNTVFEYPDTLDFETKVFRNDDDAARYVSRLISDYHSERHGPTTIVIQTPRSSMTHIIRPINDFPHVYIASHRADSAFPALDWQRYASRRVLFNFFNLGSVLHERINLARYADVPFCNIENDPPLFLADLFFARKLVKSDYVLWYSNSDRPDLGGRQEDMNRYVLDDVVNPEINTPGLYDTVCVDIDIIHLAVNTLVEANNINSIEGSIGFGFENVNRAIEDQLEGTVNSMIGGGSGQVSIALFNILRNMVKGWVSTVLLSAQKDSPISVYADMMVQHFYRWVTSHNSKLFDPCLYALVHTMMRKVFMQLVAEFKRLGSSIVYANFSRILIATTKNSLSTGKSYADSIVKSISDKPLFSIMTLDTTKYWSELAWMDTANWGGVGISTHDLETFVVSQPTDDELPEYPDEIPEPIIEMQWNIKEFLPPAVQDTFKDLVTEFVAAVYFHRLETRKTIRPGETPVKNRYLLSQSTPSGFFSPSQSASATAANISSHVSKVAPRSLTDHLAYKKAIVSTYFTRKLLKIVPQFFRNQVGASDEDETRSNYAFPRLPGSHLDLKNPTLEFIKNVTAVFNLDPQLEKEVRVMKRNLLDIVSVREFSDDARFQNPCETLKLSQVICSFCNACHDLDFCRDPAIVSSSLVASSAGSTSSTPEWKCPACEMPYDKFQIEETLLEMVMNELMMYQLQDLQCLKCKDVKMENMLLFCGTCSGDYKVMREKSAMLRKFRVVRNVANFHGLELLKECLQWVLRHS
ncbi:DNA polymerase-like protein epsilon [Paraphysoderma sedebokerense]|nr:DNA polymerase-like protein epsilon [Paraphysoderma sedebokerense]